MELRKKTTILMSERQHRHLTQLARTKGTSLGQLVRDACIEKYGLSSMESKREALRTMRSMNAPVDSVEAMKRQSVPDPKPLE